MKKINLQDTPVNTRHPSLLSYLLILATATNITMGPAESLPKLHKGYTKSEIEESLKEKRGNFAYLTYPGRLGTYALYSLYQKRKDIEENSLSQIIEETPIR